MEIDLVMIDLDGTLGIFKSHMDLPEFLLALYSRALASAFNKDEFFIRKVLLKVVSQLKSNPPLKITIAEAMFEMISSALGVSRKSLEEVTDKFYMTDFNVIQKYYKPAPKVKEVLSELFNMETKVAIATDPLVRKVGVLKRMEWIGINKFPYCFVSNADECHAAKPHPSFYEEILQRCNSEPSKAVMVGDKILNDVIPAKKLGILTIYMNRGEKEKTEDPHYTIRNLPELLNILEKLILRKRRF